MKGYCALSEIGPTQNTISRLASLNIKVHEAGMVSIKDAENCYCLNLLIEDKKKTEPFFMGLNNKQYATLALAITQEDQNNYIEQSDIDFVNFVFAFEKPITYEKVQEYNSKYI